VKKREAEPRGSPGKKLSGQKLQLNFKPLMGKKDDNPPLKLNLKLGGGGGSGVRKSETS